MAKWIKQGKTVTPEGTTIEYSLEGTGVTVESRKRHIPHANRTGTWDHTSYFVLRDGAEIRELWTLKSAQMHAEEMELEAK